MTKPIMQGNDDKTPNVSEDEIADYKKECRKANNLILKKDKYIFKSENIDPTSVKKIFYKELFDAKVKRKIENPEKNVKEKSFADIQAEIKLKKNTVPKKRKAINFKDDADDIGDVNLVYEKKRYIDVQSPLCVYLPSQELLFKMMRSCIGCQKKEDLWFYIPPPKKPKQSKKPSS